MQGVPVRRKGFTLLELVVVMAVVIIMTGIAVPAFGHAMTTSRMQAAAYQLAGDLKLMRENAILYQADLTMYFCTNPAAARTFYCFELLPRLDSTTGLPRDYLHYSPPNAGDAWPDPGRFLRRDFPYAVKLAFPPSFTQPQGGAITIDSRTYYQVTFYCGSGGHFRGQPSSLGGTVALVDQTGAYNWYVIMDSVGRIRVSAQSPAS